LTQVENHQQDKYPLVSIIVITYNSSEYVLETLESAKDQTYQNIELILSDDCSTDNTVEKCRKWLSENNDRFVNTELLITEKNTGIPANCNRGVQAAKGEWVKLIAGDDAMLEDCIEYYVKCINISPTKSVLFSNTEIYLEKFESQFKKPIYPVHNHKICDENITASKQFEILLRVNKIFTVTLFYKRIIFTQVGYFDESLRLWEDRPMLIKITKSGFKLHYVDFVSCKYRIRNSSISKRNIQLVSEFELEKSKYYYKNYVKYLPPLERLAKKILLYRDILIDKYGKNNNRLINRIIYKSVSYPWVVILKYKRYKYI